MNDWGWLKNSKESEKNYGDIRKALKKYIYIFLYDVLEVLLVAGSEMYLNTKGRLEEKDNFILNFDFDLPCRTSSRRCSRGYLGGWSWISCKLLPKEYSMNKLCVI